MRHATLLDRVLDDRDVPAAAPGGGELDPEVARLAALAQALRDDAAPAPPMRDEARTALRMALIREAGARRAAPPPWRVRARERATAVAEQVAYSTRAAGAAAMAAVVLSGGGVAAATAGSLPGDLFYGLKLGTESVALSFADPGAARGQALLDRAGGRIGEADRALRRDDVPAAAVALSHADTSARAAAQELFRAYLEDGDTRLLSELGAWVVGTNGRLDDMPPASGEAADALADLRTTMNRIGQRVEVLATGACTSCAPGVHDDPAPDPGTARGVEADGTPPLPSSAIDLTSIPAADQPFRACPCVTAPLGQDPTSAPAPAPDPAPAPVPAPADGPSPAPPSDRPPGGGSGPGSGSGGGGGAPLPDLGPITDPLPDPVRQAVEDALQQLPPVDPPAGVPAP